jgi:hypothetical protein
VFIATVAKALLIVEAVESGFWLVAAVIEGVVGGGVVAHPVATSRVRQHNSMAAWFVIFLTSREKYSTINKSALTFCRCGYQRKVFSKITKICGAKC